MVYWISRCKSVTAALVMEPQLASEIDPHPEIPANGSCQHMESAIKMLKVLVHLFVSIH